MRLSSFRGGLALGVAIVVWQAPGYRALRAQATTTLGAEAGQVQGVVVTDDTAAEPLAGAVVTLAPRAVGESIRVVTDDNGRFSAANIVSGTYVLTVTKPAYVQTEYGATRVGGPGTPLTLAAGEVRTSLVVRVPRGAVIAGTIRNLEGEPAANVVVSTSPGGADSAITDDRGEYRLWGLPPGDYLVYVSPRSTAPSAVLMSAQQIDSVLAELMRTHVGGVVTAFVPLPGTASANARQPSNAPASGAPAPTYSYATVYYPGTTEKSRAVRVTAAAGEERTGVDFALLLSGTTRITGVVLSQEGQPLTQPEPPPLTLPVDAAALASQPYLSLTIARRGASGPEPGPRPQVSMNRKDGTFVLANVTPGAYTITARMVGAPVTPPPGARGSGPAARPTSQWAQADVDVGEADIPGVTLQMQPAMTLAGRIAFDRSTKATPPRISMVHVSLAALPSSASTATPVSSTAEIHADSTFVVSGILPGRFQVAVSAPAAGSNGWWLRSIVSQGRDLLDAPLEFGASLGSLAGVTVTLSDRHTELAGLLQNAAGAPASSYYIVAFPADPNLWSAGRRLQFVRPTTDGRFAFGDLPPGEYCLAALTELDPNMWTQPDELAAFLPASVRVVIHEGERVVQNVRLTR